MYLMQRNDIGFVEWVLTLAVPQKVDGIVARIFAIERKLIPGKEGILYLV